MRQQVCSVQPMDIAMCSVEPTGQHMGSVESMDIAMCQVEPKRQVHVDSGSQ